MMDFVLGVSICLFIIFGIMYFRRPYRLINGFIFDCFLFTFLIWLVLFLGTHHNMIFRILFYFIIAVAGFILLFGIFIILGYLLINSIKMAKKEKMSLANSLSLLLLAGIVIQFIISVFFMRYFSSKEGLAIFSIINCIELFLIVTAVSFITVSILVSFHRVGSRCDYFIVLGCGLIGGKRVSPLLAGRIDKAIDAYNKQNKMNHNSKIIFSGGKGSDESISESEAMRDYAVSRGVSIDDTIIENKSVNTLENMKFSKKIMDSISNGPYSCTYVTSDFHLFRAGVYAYKAGLYKARGIGSKTKGYYIPNAMIREYIALFVMNKKFNLMIIGFVFAVYALMWIAMELKVVG